MKASSSCESCPIVLSQGENEPEGRRANCGDQELGHPDQPQARHARLDQTNDDRRRGQPQDQRSDAPRNGHLGQDQPHQQAGHEHEF